MACCRVAISAGATLARQACDYFIVGLLGGLDNAAAAIL